MSRVFFLSPNTTVEPYPVYPLGMGVVSTALRQAGYEVMQFDYLANGKSTDRIRSALGRFAPDYICISIRNIDNVDSFTSDTQWYLDGIREIVLLLRTLSDAPVICGGPGFSIMPERILDHVGGDYGVQGEGEHALIEILDKLSAGARPERITNAKHSPLGRSGQASASYVGEYVDYYLAESGIVSLQTKRGCPFKCSYCTYPYIEGPRFRPRDPVQVVDDIERLQQTSGACDFFFTDSVFNDAEGHYIGVVEEIIKRRLGIRWGSFFTPRSQDLELLPMLRESGLYAVELGTDASSDTTLRAMKKGFTFDDVLAFNQACVENRIPAAHYIIFGGPGETMETLREGLENIGRLDSCVVFGFSGIRILPGTPLHGQAIREGMIDAGQDLLRPVYYHSPRIDRDEMNGAIIESFRGDRTRIFPPSAGLEKMAFVKGFGFNGILWDTLIRFGK